MPDDKTTTTTIEPIKVAMIEGTGNGSPIPSGSVIATPDHQPNIIVQVVTPIMAITVRFGNAFFVSMVGLLTAAMTPAGGHLLYTSDFMHLMETCASLSLPIAGLGLVKDLVTVFGKLEGRYPLATGSI